MDRRGWRARVFPGVLRRSLVVCAAAVLCPALVLAGPAAPAYAFAPPPVPYPGQSVLPASVAQAGTWTASDGAFLTASGVDVAASGIAVTDAAVAADATIGATSAAACGAAWYTVAPCGFAVGVMLGQGLNQAFRVSQHIQGWFSADHGTHTYVNADVLGGAGWSPSASFPAWTPAAQANVTITAGNALITGPSPDPSDSSLNRYTVSVATAADNGVSRCNDQCNAQAKVYVVCSDGAEQFEASGVVVRSAGGTPSNLGQIVMVFDCPNVAGALSGFLQQIRIYAATSSGYPGTPTVTWSVPLPGSTDPARHWLTTYECVGSAGVSTETATSASFHEGDTDIPDVPVPSCPDGTVPVGFAVAEVNEFTAQSSPMVAFDPGPDLTSGSSEYADCLASADGAACVLEVQHQVAGTWQTCGTANVDCSGYVAGVQLDVGTWRCQWGSHTMPESDCEGFLGKFTAPSGGTPTEGVNPDPGDGTSCITSGWSWNPVSWVYVPVKCALEWAFVPSSTTVDALTSVRDTMASKPPVSVFVASGGAISGLADGFSSGGCAGFPDFSPAQDGGLQLPCTPFYQSDPVWTAAYDVMAIALSVATLFGLYRIGVNALRPGADA